MGNYRVVLIFVLIVAYLGPGLPKPIKVFSKIQEELNQLSLNDGQTRPVPNDSEYDNYRVDNPSGRESRTFGSIAPFADDDDDEDDDNDEDDEPNHWLGLKPGIVICLVFAGLALIIALPMVLCYICGRCSRRASPADLTRDPVQTLRQSISLQKGMTPQTPVYSRKEPVIRRASLPFNNNKNNYKQDGRRSSTRSDVSVVVVGERRDSSNFQIRKYSVNDGDASAPRRLSIQNQNPIKNPKIGFESFLEKS